MGDDNGCTGDPVFYDLTSPVYNKPVNTLMFDLYEFDLQTGRPGDGVQWGIYR